MMRTLVDRECELRSEVGVMSLDPYSGLERPAAATSGGVPPTAAHRVAYRASLPLLGRRYYFAMFLGSEKRTPQRVLADNQRKGWLHTLFGLVSVLALTCTMLMSTLAVAYLLKSALGIDLSEDHFFLHALFFN